MRRLFAIAAIVALAMPSMAMAQEHEHGKGPPPRGRPAAGRAVPRGVPGRPGPVRAGPIHPGPMRAGPMHAGPMRPGGHPAFVFHGHPYAWHAVHFPRPWVYPPGYAYRLWAVGAILPPLFWREPTYYYTGWAGMGLPPPEPGYQYVEYGPDLLLVNVTNGQVVQVFPGAFD
jgi:Nickel/cobalt transporter regulator